MSDFLIFFDKVKDWYKFRMEIYYSTVMDYCISIFVGDKKIISIQDNDVELIFAKAQCELKQWLLDNNDGY